MLAAGAPCSGEGQCANGYVCIVGMCRPPNSCSEPAEDCSQQICCDGLTCDVTNGTVCLTATGGSCDPAVFSCASPNNCQVDSTCGPGPQAIAYGGDCTEGPCEDRYSCDPMDFHCYISPGQSCAGGGVCVSPYSCQGEFCG